jgi:hypothetical protein
MRYYCTFFDHNYLGRGLTLYESLQERSGPFRLYVLCMSDACHQALSKLGLPHMELIALEEFERGDDALLAAKSNRTLIEYYFTCTPSLFLYLFRKHLEIDFLCYLDSDIYFFSDPEQVLTEIGQHSIAITPHRFAPELKKLERCGIYNAGWVGFRRDAEGLACMEEWRNQCIAWCYDRCENGLYAGQNYLDAWPAKYKNVKILDHPGMNTAPWNLSNSDLSAGPQGILVDGQPLVFFHFHGLKPVTPHVYDPHMAPYSARPTPMLRRVYGPYIERWERNKKLAAELTAGMQTRSIRVAKGPPKSALRQAWRRSRFRRYWYGAQSWWRALRGEYLIVWRGRLIR